MARGERTVLIVAALVLAGTVVGVTGGCGGGVDSVDVRSVAIVMSGKGGEIGWNQQGFRAARAVARELHVNMKTVQNIGDDSPRAELERLSRHDAQLVIAHGRGYASVAAGVARRTSVPELVFGSSARSTAGLIGDIEVASEEGGYLAGYIAARASYVRDVGIVVASDDPAWYRTAGGFVAGARRFDPHVKIGYVRVGGSSEDDPEASRRAARRLILNGAQMVLGLGERSTLGVLHATEDALGGQRQPRFDAMFIDVIGDKSQAGDRGITGLTAVTWNFLPAYRRAIRDLRAGRFGDRPYRLDLANGGVSVIADGRTPSDTFRAALQLGRKIVRGAIKVPVTTTDAQVRQLLG